MASDRSPTYLMCELADTDPRTTPGCAHAQFAGIAQPPPTAIGQFPVPLEPPLAPLGPPLQRRHIHASSGHLSSLSTQTFDQPASPPPPRPHSARAQLQHASPSFAATQSSGSTASSREGDDVDCAASGPTAALHCGAEQQHDGASFERARSGRWTGVVSDHCARRHLAAAAGPNPVCAIEFNAHSGRLLAARVRKSVDILVADMHAPSGAEPQLASRIQTPSKVTAAAWCPSQPHLCVVGDADGVLNVYDTERGRSVAEIDEHGGHAVRAVAPAALPRGVCASAGGDGGIRLWRGPLLEDAGARFGGGAQVATLAWCPDSHHELLSGDSAGCVALWDIRSTAQPLVEWQAHDGPCSRLATGHACGVVSADSAGRVRMWDTSAELRAGTARMHEVPSGAAAGAAVVLAVHAAGWVATGRVDGGVTVSHTLDRAPVWLSDAGASPVTSAAWQRAAGVCGLPPLALGDAQGVVRVFQATP